MGGIFYLWQKIAPLTNSVLKKALLYNRALMMYRPPTSRWLHKCNFCDSTHRINLASRESNFEFRPFVTSLLRAVILSPLQRTHLDEYGVGGEAYTGKYSRARSPSSSKSEHKYNRGAAPARENSNRFDRSEKQKRLYRARVLRTRALACK